LSAMEAYGRVKLVIEKDIVEEKKSFVGS